MAVKRRKHISLQAKLDAALYQLGLDPKTAQLDHSPALVFREWDDATQDTIPPASDPRYLRWLSSEDHRVKTSGKKGVTSAGSDVHMAAKIKRITGETPKRPARKIKSRGFPKRR